MRRDTTTASSAHILSLTKPPDVLLACMPFGPVFSPSLGLSLLKASLRTDGITAAVRYFSLDFATRIGQHAYCGIANGTHPPVVDLAGDWIFAAALSPTSASDEYIDRILVRREARPHPAAARAVSQATIRRIRAARDHVEPFLAKAVAEIVQAKPAVLGLTSVFQQHVACLALARRVKNALPATFIVLGGANCEGVMGAETVRQFPFIDAVVSGEAEAVFPVLVRRMLSGLPFDDLPGVRSPTTLVRDFACGAFPNARSVERLDELPYPDFTDFLAQFRASVFDRHWLPIVPFETSRGCWWGAKHHCTFCGLNGSSMAFRAKSPSRAMAELDALTAQAPGSEVQVVDNILDMQYFKSVLPALAERSSRVNLFYETKANLRKDQVRLLRDAGVTAIQPGIESFSDRVLKQMRKGVTALQNIQLLKWCKELGVEPIWNLIWGFPGEEVADYVRTATLVRRLFHLPPPRTFDGLRLDRFSPHFDEAERFGFAGVRPLESYRLVYGLPDEALGNLAYFFAFRHRNGRDHATEAAPLLRALRAWTRAHRQRDLVSVDEGDRLLVWDARRAGPIAPLELSGVDRVLLLACHAIADKASLVEVARGAGGGALVDAHLSRLVALGLVIEDGGRYLGLDIPVGDYRPAPHLAARLSAPRLRWSGMTPATFLEEDVNGKEGRKEESREEEHGEDRQEGSQEDPQESGDLLTGRPA